MVSQKDVKCFLHRVPSYHVPVSEKCLVDIYTLFRLCFTCYHKLIMVPAIVLGTTVNGVRLFFLGTTIFWLELT